MEAADAAKTNSLGMPRYIEWQIGAATLTAMRKVQREAPDQWAKIKARAAEIRREEAFKNERK